MGDAPASPANHKPDPTVELVVRADAHVDVADLPNGSVSKTAPLRVSAAEAKRLLARHPYLTQRKG